MNVFEEADAMKKAMELCSMTQSELGERLGVTQSYIANKLRLLTLSEEEREIIIGASLTERHARAVLRLKDRKKRLEILEKVRDRGLTVRECEALVDIAYEGEKMKELGGGAYQLIDGFVKRIKGGVKTLVCYGVDARVHEVEEKDTVYLTVTIKR